MSDEKRVTLNPVGWSYQDYADFLNAYIKQNFQRAMKLAMKIIVAWDYDIAPTADAYFDLTAEDLPKILYAISETLDAYVKGLDTSTLRLELKNWSMRDYFNYQKAGRAGDVATIEVLFKKAVRLDGINEARLTFEQGALISKAVTERVKELFAQGN